MTNTPTVMRSSDHEISVYAQGEQSRELLSLGETIIQWDHKPSQWTADNQEWTPETLTLLHYVNLDVARDVAQLLEFPVADPTATAENVYVALVIIFVLDPVQHKPVFKHVFECDACDIGIGSGSSADSQNQPCSLTFTVKAADFYVPVESETAIDNSTPSDNPTGRV